MTFIRSVFAFLVSIICLYFALLQLKDVSFTFSPLHDPIDVNQALLLLLFYALGFLSGAVIVWLGLVSRGGGASRNKENAPMKRDLDQILKGD